MKKTVLVVVATALLVSACTTTDPYTGDQKISNTAAGAGLDGEAGAEQLEPLPPLAHRQARERAVARQPIERTGRHPHRRGDAHLDPRQCGEAERLAFDEHAEIGSAGVGKQGREGQHAEHRREC